MNRVRVGQVLAVIGAVVGYVGVGQWVGSTDCGVVTYGSPVPDCGFIDSLLFRFENFAKMAGALLLAQPGMILWLNSDDAVSKSKPPAQD